MGKRASGLACDYVTSLRRHLLSDVTNVKGRDKSELQSSFFFINDSGECFRLFVVVVMVILFVTTVVTLIVIGMGGDVGVGWGRGCRG